MDSDVAALTCSVEGYHEARTHPTGDALPPVPHAVLRHIADTGLACFPWVPLRTVLCEELDRILLAVAAAVPLGLEDAATFETDRKYVLEHLRSLDGVPFTIQRICEIVVDPGRYHTKKDGIVRPIKLMNSIRKSVTVYTTVATSVVPTTDCPTANSQ